jgi:two-component system, NarL family, nitrate/nitrite response regulator NarL
VVDGVVATDRQSARPTLVVISAQALLAETLGAQLAASGGWSVKVLDAHHPDLLHTVRLADATVILLDVDDLVVPGMRLLSQLVEALPSVGVLVLCEAASETVSEAIERGARGCLTYAASIDDIRDAIDAVVSGRTVVPPADLTALIEGLHAAPAENQPARFPALSQRELEVLRHLTAGESTRVIASELGIGVPTVRKHIQNILSKLGVHSKLQAAASAVRHGIV